MRRRDDHHLFAALLIALLLHLLAAMLFARFGLPQEVARAPAPSVVVELSPPDEALERLPEERPPDPTRPDEEQRRRIDPLTGQVVELPDPEVEEEPEDAQYLASKSRRVLEETRAERFKINPEILSPTYSEDAPQQEKRDLQRLREERDSQGAPRADEPVPPSERDRRDRQAREAETQPDGLEPAPPDDSEFALYPERFSRWTYLEPVGPDAPASSAAAQDRRGAPQNDYLNEKVGDATLLNTREFLYADYFNKVRRLVNFWWSQNLDNLSPGDIDQTLRRPTYKTLVIPTLDADGRLVKVDLVKGCGVRAFDKAVLDAWASASPFPKPPDGLVVNGKAELIRFDFILELGHGQSQYTAIDPRSDVRFPGIAWPR